MDSCTGVYIVHVLMQGSEGAFIQDHCDPLSKFAVCTEIVRAYYKTSYVVLCKMNESVVTVLSLMKVMTRKKCWKEREAM